MRIVQLCMLSLLLPLSLTTATRGNGKAKHAHKQHTTKGHRSVVKPPAKAPAHRHVPVELSNSFIITSYQDLQPQNIHGRFMTPCEYAVARARAIGGKRFSIVNTAYWIGGAGRVERYSYKDVSSRHPQGFAYDRVGSHQITRWKRGLQRCIRAAIRSGFTGLQILNHIDQGASPAAWRNMLDFDPLVKHGGFSYEDVVVRPAVDALRTASKRSTKVWFMISGEMGRSLFKHPKSYMALISKYRGALRRGKDARKVKVGIALHWNKVCGDCFFVPYSPSARQYNGTYRRAWEASKWYIKRNFEISDIQRLFAVNDVIGVSAYAPAPLAVTPDSFAVPFDTAAYELKFWGVDQEKLVMRQGKEFVFSEVGLGGAAPDGNTVAYDLRSLAEGVANGVWAIYNVAQDPWRRPDYRAYRRQWFSGLLGFLRRGGSPHGRVSAAFMWSSGSFDSAAISPISVSSEGTYGDTEIIGWMKRTSAISP